jgi:hypothetical protein
MDNVRPTPSCTRFRAVEAPCARCGGEMKLALAEPRGPSVEMLTYTCGVCGSTETFLMAV